MFFLHAFFSSSSQGPIPAASISEKLNRLREYNENLKKLLGSGARDPGTAAAAGAAAAATGSPSAATKTPVFNTPIGYTVLSSLFLSYSCLPSSLRFHVSAPSFGTPSSPGGFNRSATPSSPLSKSSGTVHVPPLSSIPGRTSSPLPSSPSTPLKSSMLAPASEHFGGGGPGPYAASFITGPRSPRMAVADVVRCSPFSRFSSC